MPIGIIKYNEKTLKNPNIEQDYLLCYHNKNILGSGTFGQVYKTDTYAMHYSLKKLTFNNTCVVKVMHKIDSEIKKVIMNEYELGKKALHLGMKKPIFTSIEASQTCHLLMNHLPGKE